MRVTAESLREERLRHFDVVSAGVRLAEFTLHHLSESSIKPEALASARQDYSLIAGGHVMTLLELKAGLNLSPEGFEELRAKLTGASEA